MINLSGKVAVVTGGSGGIGMATVSQLLSAGAHVVVADRDEAKPRDAAENLPCTYIQLDIRDSQAVDNAVLGIVDKHKRLDIWVNNAGATTTISTLETSDAIWADAVETNLNGPFYCARAAGRYMSQNGGGAIVNVSSVAAFQATRPETHAAYDAAKAGIAQLTRVLAAEWAQHGIRVNSVAPGYTNTAILQGVGASNPETMKQWLSQIPAGRLVEPHEIGQVITFLASDAASAINGQIVFADGGWSLW
ncbi:MAG: SDR family NAD(P)-dependent oxidoreductase [Rhodococcus sp. (in: high G+C Gram-positive bacteria)]